MTEGDSMSEEATMTQSESEYQGEPLVEKAVSQEVEPNNQDEQANAHDVSKLVAESRKYRSRAQNVEAELSKLQKSMESDRQKQMEEQNQWQQLAEERAAKIAELEPIVEIARADEASQREQLIADLSEEDRETFGDLPLTKLRVLHAKLTNQTQKLPVASNPAVAANEVPKDWFNMNQNDRSKQWGKIVAGYVKK